MNLTKIKDAASKQDFKAACAAFDEQRKLYKNVSFNSAFTGAQKETSRRQLQTSFTYLTTHFFAARISDALAREDEDEAARLLAEMKLYSDRISIETPDIRRTTRTLLEASYHAIQPFSDSQKAVMIAILHPRNTDASHRLPSSEDAA